MRTLIITSALLYLLNSCNSNTQSAHKEIPNSAETTETEIVENISILVQSRGVPKNVTIAPSEGDECSIKSSPNPTSNHEDSDVWLPNGANFPGKVKTEYHKVQSDQEQVITGVKGTRIEIPTYAFRTIDGELVEGEIEVSLQECYSAVDLLRLKMPTTSNGQLLQTGGSIIIKATYRGEDVVLSKPMELFFPVIDEPLGAMSTFVGEKVNGVVNWRKEGAGKTAYSLGIKNTTVSYDGERGIFLNSGLSLEEAFASSFDTLLQSNSAFQVFYKIVSGGKISNINVTSSVHVDLRHKIKEFFDTLTLDKGIGLGGTACHVAVWHEINNVPRTEFDIVEHHAYSGNYTGHKEKLEVVYKKPKEAIQAIGNKKYYALKTNTLGYINCDRFLRDPSPKYNLMVSNNDSVYTVACLILPEINSVMMKEGYKSQILQNIPLNTKYDLLVMRRDGKDYKIYRKKGFVKRSAVFNESFEDISAAGLIDMMKGLKLNGSSLEGRRMKS